MTRPVVVVGDLAVDVVARLAAAPAPGSDTDASITMGGGGAGGNVAAWLARLDVPVSLVAVVGDDGAGREQVAVLEATGVTCRVRVEPQAHTGVVVVLVAPDGERTMLPDRGANRRLAPADIDAADVADAAWLHLSGYSLLDPRTRPATLYALRTAVDAGVAVSVDPASWRPLRDAGAERFLSWTAGVSLSLPNAAEAAVLTGRDDPDAAARRLAARYAEVVVSLGARGALWSDGRGIVRAPAVACDVVDTTGAGDALAAGFVAARLAGHAPAQCLRLACATAARAVAGAGSRPPAP